MADAGAQANGPGPSRRRYVSVLFGDLSESTRIAATLEAELYSELLAAMRQAAEEVVARHGGTIVQLLGDGVVAIFGYPAAQEDDGRRATEAALDLHARIRGIPLEQPLPWRKALGMHSGIHSGLVLVEVGDHARGRVALVGDAPNIAARLSDEAQDGEILVSAATLGPEVNFFEAEGPRMLALDGRTELLAVYRVLGRSVAGNRYEARARRGLSAFVGRQAELALLDEALRGAMAGRPARVALVASAGVGKTRLVEEFLRRAQALDCTVCRGYCESYLGAEPMQPFRQMLRALMEIAPGMPAAEAASRLDAALARIGPALAVHRGALLQAISLGDAALENAGRAAPEQVLLAMRELFAALAARGPLVVFIDDWQWADDATRVVVGALREIGEARILGIVAMRELESDTAKAGDTRIVRLDPLSDEEASETIARLLPGVEPFVAASIRRDSGGNALFLEELCHSMRHAPARANPVPGAGTAAWLDALIASRVERLPETEAALVRTAAVIGNVIPAWLLEQLTGCGEHHPAVQSLATHDFLYPGTGVGTLRFKHGIAREAIYAAIGLRERRALHARIAGALGAEGAQGVREDALEMLAYHYRAAGDVAQAARYAERAGDKALAASALDRAQAQYLAALDSIDPSEPSRAAYERWSAIANRLASACVYDPSREQLQVFTRAVALAAAHDDAHGGVTAEYWLGYIHYALGEARAAIGHFESARAKAAALGDAAFVAQLCATLGQARAAACEYDAALELFDGALSVKRQHRSAARPSAGSASRPSVGSAYTLACKAAVLGDRGRFREAAECLDEALEGLHGVHHVVRGSVLNLQSAVLLWQGRWEAARNAALEAKQVAKRVKSLYLLAMSRALAGYADWVVSGAPRSLQGIADATAWLESRDRGLFISLNHGWLAEALVASGQVAPARRHAARALWRARGGDRLGAAMAWRALARAAARGQGRTPAAACLERAMQVAQARGSPHEGAVTQLCAAELALAREARDEAARFLEPAAEAFERLGMDWHLDAARALIRQT